MTHRMKLRPRPFAMIASGDKTIELRLYDEKRKTISVGDTLIFENTDNSSDKLVCAVKRLHIFTNFEELYSSLPLDKCGYLAHELSVASASDMEEYYSKEEQYRYGVVGIELERV